MKQILFYCVIGTSLAGTAQQSKYVSVAVLNTQNALPFGKFSTLFNEAIHPGFEIGYGKIIKPVRNHEWYMEGKLSYFYHRFVQHGIPLYGNFGYRYKFNKSLSAETSLGAGYMHSIPATAKLKLNEQGDYENDKGAGRMQAIAAYGLGIGYHIRPGTEKQFKIFCTYQQRLQFPFVKSYVPLLPYNSFIMGVSRSINKK